MSGVRTIVSCILPQLSMVIFIIIFAVNYDELQVSKREWGCLWMEGDRLTEWLFGGIPSNSFQFRAAGSSLSMNKRDDSYHFFCETLPRHG